MSHPEQIAFVSLVSRFSRPNWEGKRILEIGSYDVNGSVRKLFETCAEYIGADLVAGPGVDIVVSGHEIGYADESFDLTISCECFEHNPYWLETFKNMIRMTKPGGLSVFTCASRGRLEHGTMRTDQEASPGTTAAGIDYYRNLREKDFTRALNMEEIFADHTFFYIPESKGLHFIGIKRGPVKEAVDLPSVHREMRNICKLTSKRKLSLRSVYNLVSERIPLNVFSLVLPEKQFQDVAVFYLQSKAEGQNILKRRLKLRF